MNRPIQGSAPLGALALELLNTLRPPRERPLDLAGSPAELLAWLRANGLADRWLPTLGTSPPAAARLLTETRRLRADVGRSLEAFRRRNPPPTDALHGIDRVLGAGSVSRRLVVGPGGPRLVDEATGADLLAALAPIALAAAEVLTEADPRRVRRCASPGCAAWFLDTSKGSRRKWCSMARCGNRAKAREHRRRRGAGRASGS